MSKPTIDKGINSYDFHWKDEQIKIRVSRLIETNTRGLQADILVSTTKDLPATHIHQSTLGLFSLSARNEVIRTLKKRAPEYDWENILEQLCVLAPRYYRAGEDAETLWTMDESVTAPSQFISPLVLKNEINMIFGEGGAGKSYLALYLALCVSVPLFDNPLGLGILTGERQHNNCLLLDWETYKGQVQWRWKMIANGIENMAAQNIGIEYRRCSLPLVDDLEQIQKFILEKDIKFAIVDSVAMASGADINTPAVAIGFMNAVRQLPCTVLLVHHTSKDALGRKSPFGSVYFTNASRSVWEIKSTQQPGGDSIKVGLWHTKHNYSAKAEPIGAEIYFGADSVTFKRIQIEDVPEFQDKAPVIIRIERAIQDGGSMTVKKLSNNLSVAPSQVLYVLKNNPERFMELVVRGDESKWDLVTL